MKGAGGVEIAVLHLHAFSKVDNQWQLLLDGLETGKADQEETPRTTKNGLERGVLGYLGQ